MFPTQTIYVTAVDLTTLNMIFNGAAMICQQTAFIWGFAMLAAMWTILSITAKTAIASVSGNVNGVPATGHLSAVLPFLLAIVLTSPSLKSNIQIQSTTTGNVAVIANVPIAISLIPVAGSILSRDASNIVKTAYQGAGTDYASISAADNGFINPLKVLLASRSAIDRLNGLSSQVHSLVKDCISTGPVDYANLGKLVINAGNTGATAAQSIAIHGANPTSLGALLYAASLSPGFVNEVYTTPGTFLSCNDAANVIAANIENALLSAEFSRVIQGGVNGMDQPSNPTNLTIDKMVTEWGAVRNAATVNGAISAGSQKATQEVINLLMGEMVNNELSCIQASGQADAICESALLQANEIERSNIQNAAAEVPMLKYAGSFGNLLMALIIGLGPIIVMFMMFGGVGAGKSLKTVTHLIVWPFLVTNVGAEVINGMIYVNVANFCNGLAYQGGVLAQAQNFALYKELSFQIGSASHLMASLPVIMSMIFALGESAALTSVASNLGPRTENTKEHVAPTISKQDAVLSQSGINQTTHMPDGFETKFNGALPMINAQSSAGQVVMRASDNISRADGIVRTQTEAANVAKENAKGVVKGHESSLGFTEAERIAYANWDSQQHGNSSRTSTGTSAAASHSNEKSLGANAGLGIGGSTSGGGVGFSGNVGIKGSASTTDRLSYDEHAGKEDAVSQSRDVGSKLEHMRDWAKNVAHNDRLANDLTRRISAQNSYTESLTANQSYTDTVGKALDLSSSVTAVAANITDQNISSEVSRNADYAMYDATNRGQLEQNEAYKRNLDVATRDANNAVTTDIGGNAAGREAALRFRAAQMTIGDTNATPEQRFGALKYVTGALSQMTHSSTNMNDLHNIAQPKEINNLKDGTVATPTNRTGQELPQGVMPATHAAPTVIHPHKQHHHAAHDQAHVANTPANPPAENKDPKDVEGRANSLLSHGQHETSGNLFSRGASIISDTVTKDGKIESSATTYHNQDHKL